MKRNLPANPSLVQLKHQAKDLLKQSRTGGSLSDMQLVIAREYGFASWPKLKHYVEGLATVEARISRLRNEFAAGDAGTKRRLLSAAHTKERFESYDPDAPSLSNADARLLVANQEGYAFWSKYESYLHLDPGVQRVITAVRAGDLKGLREVLRMDRGAANPKWVADFPPPKPISNDSVPLFCVSEAVFRGTNAQDNEYELTRSLVAAGADIEVAGDLVLTGAVSFNAIRVVEALLDSGASVDGVDGDGVPMAYAMHFRFPTIAELMVRRGAKTDLRFAAGLGKLDVVKSWFHADGSLKPHAGALADPYGYEHKQHGESPFRCERTRENILSQALYFACVHDQFETADFLLSRGADIDAIVPGLDIRATILHRIATMSDARAAAKTIRFLLDHGASPEVRDEEFHSTPINWARFGGHDENVAALLGARDASGQT